MTLNFNLPSWQALLCEALAAEDSAQKIAATRALWRAADDASLFAFANENEVDAILGHALIDAFGAENVAVYWRAAHENTSRRISAYLEELDDISSRLAESAIPLVALKNAGLARGIYPCPGCCPMGDLDILVEKRHFRRAHEILLSDGFHFEFRSSLEKADLQAAERGGGAEYWKELLGGEKLWFELQWRPVAGRWIRPDQEPPAEQLMARSVEIPGTAVRLLAPEDNLLQVALHTAKHSYVRAPGFRLHTDVDRIVRRQTIDWDLFLSRTLALQVKTAVFFSLAIPKALFETPIPNEVLTRLKPAVWKEHLISHWLQRAGLFNPDERKFSRPGYILFTALLYDDLRGLWRAVFPNQAWMRERYNITHSLLLPFYYLRRLVDLAFRRAM